MVTMMVVILGLMNIWQAWGKIGQFYRRVFWRRLGMTLKLRDRVYEISSTDPVKIAIMGAELQISGTICLIH